jgi:hypothetical protein
MVENSGRRIGDIVGMGAKGCSGSRVGHGVAAGVSAEDPSTAIAGKGEAMLAF